MAKFTVRVELHNHPANGYTLLHNEMQAQGFYRTIVGPDRLAYALPSAEYIIDQVLSKTDVMNRARNAANSVVAVARQQQINMSYEIFVTVATDWDFYNLPRATI